MIRAATTPRPLLMLGLALLLAAAHAGCDDDAPRVPKKTAWQLLTPAGRAEAKRAYTIHCKSCHGPAGKGDGPASKDVDPKPRSFADAAWQRSVSDAHIERCIVEGGAAVGKSVVMPPNPKLAKQPAVVRALRAYVRHLGGR